MSKPNKTAIGLGVACVACCAVPIGVVLIGGGALGASLFTGEKVIIITATVLFLGLIGRYLYKRNKKSHEGACDLNCSCKDKQKKGIC